MIVPNRPDNLKSSGIHQKMGSLVTLSRLECSLVSRLKGYKAGDIDLCKSTLALLSHLPPIASHVARENGKPCDSEPS